MGEREGYLGLGLQTNRAVHKQLVIRLVKAQFGSINKRAELELDFQACLVNELAKARLDYIGSVR